MPRSAFSRRIVSAIPVRFSGSGSGLWANSPVGSQFSLHDFAPQPPQLRHHDAAHGIHGVHDHLEAAFADRLGVHERKRQHLLDMRPVERFARKHMPDAVHAGVLEALLLGHRQHALALGVGEEFAVGVEQAPGRSTDAGCATR